MWNPFTLFGSSKKVGEIAEKVSVGFMDGIDAAWYTDEEKARDAKERHISWLRMMEATAGENSIRSITRRVLAFSIVIPFMGLMILTAITYKLDPGWSQFCLELIREYWGIVMLVAGFFFGPYEVAKLNYFKNKGKG